MQCPVDGATLVMTARAGVEIDYCPQCRGVWLDRGELDKIIERSASVSVPPPPPPTSDDGDRFADRETRMGGDDHGYGRKKRKESRMSDFLGDIFDF